MINATQVADVLRDAVGVAIRLAAPALVLSLLVGVLVTIFQAVTQIHEQSIGFMLKLIVVISVLLIGGGWMLDNLQDFAREIFDLIATS